MPDSNKTMLSGAFGIWSLSSHCGMNICQTLLGREMGCSAPETTQRLWNLQDESECPLGGNICAKALAKKQHDLKSIGSDMHSFCIIARVRHSFAPTNIIKGGLASTIIKFLCVHAQGCFGQAGPGGISGGDPILFARRSCHVISRPISCLARPGFILLHTIATFRNK